MWLDLSMYKTTGSYRYIHMYSHVLYMYLRGGGRSVTLQFLSDNFEFSNSIFLKILYS